jgi:spore germination protein GerM
MRRLFLITAALALVVGACGSSDVGSAGSVTIATSVTETSTTEPTPPDTTSPPPSTDGASTTSTTVASETTPPPAEEFVDIYLVKDGAYAVAVPRTVAGPDLAANAVRVLLDGPTPSEQGDGLSTPVPEDTLLLGVVIEDGVATVDLSREYEAGGGSFGMLSRLAVVVYTLTQFPTVDAVSFRLDGEPVTVFGGEGIVVDPPVTRSDFEGSVPIGHTDGGDTGVWSQGDLPPLDGVETALHSRVALVPEDDTLNVRTGAGVDHGILGSLPPGVVVARTGSEQPVGSATWAEIATPVGPGWVNDLFLAAVVEDGAFAADGTVDDLLDELATIISADGELSEVASRRGIHVSHHGPLVRYPVSDLDGILTDPTTYKWPSAALDINDPDQAAELPDRTFAEAVTDRFLSAYDDPDTRLTRDTPVEAGNSRPPELAIPFELQEFHYVAVHDPGDNPDFGGLDWITWYVSIDYEDGEPRIVGLTVDEWSP